MLVCIAGTDGSGKSTLVSNLQKSLSEEYRCSHLRLYETTLYPALQKRAALYLYQNKIELTHYNLVMAYLRYELEEKSYPNLVKANKENEIVILDRYLETIEFINSHFNVDPKLLPQVLSKFEKPDLYIFLKVPPRVCYDRIRALRTPGDGEHLDEIEAAYSFYTKNKEHYGFYVVDGEESIHNLQKNCMNIIKNTFCSHMIGRNTNERE